MGKNIFSKMKGKSLIDNRLDRIDLVKGIAIILMVYGHTFGIGRSFVYLFHMAVFFMASGYCWTDEKVDSISKLKNYIFRRYWSLMIPYVICNVVFMLLHNVFVIIGFFSNDVTFAELAQGFPATQELTGYCSAKTILYNIYKAMTFDYNPVFGGITWFLYTLFFVSVFHGIICYLFRRNKKIKAILPIIEFVLLCFCLQLIINNRAAEWIEMRHLRLIPAYVAYLLGVLIRRVNELISPGVITKRVGGLLAVSSFILLVLLEQYGEIEISKCIVHNTYFFVACSLLGWGLLYGFAIVLEDFYVGKTLIYIGKETLAIMFLHQIAFKIVSYLYVGIEHKPFYLVASFPVIFNVSEFIKCIYTVVGCIFPLIAVNVINNLLDALNSGRTNRHQLRQE